jgi:putative hemolysin
MANPAAVYCEEQGGVIESRTDENGMYGVCHFPDGSSCNQWDFFRGECAPGDNSSDISEKPNVDETEPVIGMANPASVYCEEQGGVLEMRAGENGMYGVCHFSDGSSCEEWAFFRGECKPGLDISKTYPVFGWYGTVISPPASQPYEYYLMLYPKEAGSAGLIPMNDEVESKLLYLRDSGRLAHFWGTLNCAVEGFQGCQVEVTEVRPEGPGVFFAPDRVDGWQGILNSTPYDEPGSYPDDAFTLVASEVTPWAALFPVQYGIHTTDHAMAGTLDALRDTGSSFTVYGELTCGIPDTNGCQIVVDRIEGNRGFVPAPAPAGIVTERVADWCGVIKSTPDGAQFDDYFEKFGYNGGSYGIESSIPEIAQQLVDLRDSGKQVRLWGVLMTDVLDYGGTQIDVTRMEVIVQPEGPEIVEKVVEDWVGVIVSFEEAAQIDDYFQMMDQDGTRVGIWGEGELGTQLSALRDTGTVIHVWGVVRYNVPDAYGAQIAVTRIELE